MSTALRLLEMTVPRDQLGTVEEELEDCPAHGVWISESSDDMRLVRVLVDARDVEKLSDSLIDRLGQREELRMILLPVEATMPAIEREEEKEEEEDGSAADESEKSRGPLRRISREELYEDLTAASRLTPVYLITVALSTVVAAVGLIRADVAIVIGAMVIAPLLGPNVALSLACTLGDPQLAWRSLKTALAGLLVAAALSAGLGLVVRVDPENVEIASRTTPDLGDLVLALAAGAAGSLAFTTGVPAAVVGVMVAVALLPPLVVAGLLLGGGETTLALAALVLLTANVTCVNLAAIATFLVQKVRPRTWWEAERARSATWIAVAVWILLLAVLVTLMLLGLVGGLGIG